MNTLATTSKKETYWYALRERDTIFMASLSPGHPCSDAKSIYDLHEALNLPMAEWEIQGIGKKVKVLPQPGDPPPEYYVIFRSYDTGETIHLSSKEIWARCNL